MEYCILEDKNVHALFEHCQFHPGYQFVHVSNSERPDNSDVTTYSSAVQLQQSGTRVLSAYRRFGLTTSNYRT
jgi:hypothetical protein